MDMEFRYTRHQVARISRPDAENHNSLYLVKNVSEMRATYQVRYLSLRAQKTGKKLVICMPKGAIEHRSLRALRRETGKLIKIDRR